MKRKIGMAVDDQLYRNVKLRAAREGLKISEIVERALADYLRRSKVARSGNAGLMRLLGREPLKVTDAQFREILDLDYFDQ